ncbi:MAG: hypothetical protein G01um101470_587 [Parcubacteria group bacterium Gr01-1014_70]|nr:MAG: hypothetical protein G01um101470_587 [Parcubacteria group bacterium Gr01-1014_70]
MLGGGEGESEKEEAKKNAEEPSLPTEAENLPYPAQSEEGLSGNFSPKDKGNERYSPKIKDARLLGERSKESVFWIETAKIKPNPEQPRTTFDEEKIRAMAESIRQYGILQPIVVSKREIDVPTGTQVEYQIIAGERRYRAAQMIGLAHMPAIIRREESDRIKLELALIENLQREDLQPLEKAHAYKRLVKEFGLSQKEVGMRVGKSREAVTNTMRLLFLPEYVQQSLAAGHISEGQARPLITLTQSPDEQRLLFERIAREGLGSREIEHAASQIIARVGYVVRSTRKTDKAAYDAATRLYETKLADALGTRVSVKRAHNGKGKISIEFFSNEELQNLLLRMASAQPEEGEKPVDNNEGAARPEDLSTFTV